VFARWISNIFKSTTPFELNASHGRSKKGLGKFAVYSRAACKQCNNGWMSVVEQRAKPLLERAFFGEALTWNADEQQVVSTWVLKTAPMLDRSNHASHHAPLRHFSRLYETKAPPELTQVEVGFYTPTEGEEVRGVWAGTMRGAQSHRDSYRVCFSVGRIVFLVHGYENATGEPLHVNTMAVSESQVLVPLWETFELVWPRSTTAFRFPPPQGFTLNNGALEALTDTPLMQAAIAGDPSYL